MGQARNSGRNATLDEMKSRAAGRRNTNSPQREAIRDWQMPVAMKGKTGGAAGRSGSANTKGRGGQTRGAGGGGGAQSGAAASHLTVSRSTRPARKRAAR